jgi:hypothetical protein
MVSDSEQGLRSELVTRLARELAAVALTYPPPEPDCLSPCLALLRTVSGNGDPDAFVEAAVAHLGSTFPSQHLPAVAAVVQSSLDHRKHPWPHTLAIAEHSWSVWATPYLLAAGVERRGDHRLALVLAAERRARVGSDALTTVLEQLVSSRNDVSEQRTRLSGARLLAEHRPSYSALSRWAERASALRDYSELEQAIQHATSVFGVDPAQWDVPNIYEALTAAGHLCGLTNKLKAHTRDEHDFLAWNRTAIDLLERSLKVSGSRPPEERWFAANRLAESYANMLRYMPWNAHADERASLIARAKELIEAIGRSRAQNAFGAQRMLAQICAGEATRARHMGVDRAIIDTYIDRADQAYHDLYVYADRKKKPMVARWRAELLAEHGRHEDARKVGELSDAPELYWRREVLPSPVQGHRAAIRGLIRSMTDDPHTHLITKCAYELHRQLVSAEERGARLAPRLVEEAHEHLRSAVPALVSACRKHLESGRLDLAERSLRVGLFAEPNAPNLLHLAGRLARAYRDAERNDRCDNLVGAVWESVRGDASLLQDDFLRSMVLNLMRAGSSITLTAAEVWTLATTPRHGRLDAHDLSAALYWQAESGELDGFADHLRLAASTFPLDPYFYGVPARVLARHCGREHEVLVLGAFEALAPSHADWVASCLDLMPGSFYFSASDALNRLLSLVCSISRKPKRLLVALFNGLVRGLVEASDDDERERRAQAVAASIAAVYGRDVWLWCQWFGAGKHAFEERVVAELEEQLSGLKTALFERGDATLRDWHNFLTDFLTNLTAHSMADAWSGQGLASREIVQFCRDASRAFTHLAPDPAYWRQMANTVGGCLATLPDADIEEVMAATWLAVHRATIGSTRHSLVTVAYHRLHTFRHGLEPYLSGRHGRDTSSPQPVPQPIAEKMQQILADTLRHLAWHRRPRTRVVDVGVLLRDVALPRSPAYTRTAATAQRNLWAVRPDKPVLADVDPEMMREAIRCLIQNAHKAIATAHEDGTIYAEVRVDGECLRIEVRDNGVGAVPEVIAKLNEASTARFSGSGGTGFGTRLAHRVAQVHGGRLVFASDGEGLGLIATLTVPLRRLEEHDAVEQ